MSARQQLPADDDGEYLIVEKILPSGTKFSLWSDSVLWIETVSTPGAPNIFVELKGDDVHVLKDFLTSDAVRRVVCETKAVPVKVETLPSGVHVEIRPFGYLVLTSPPGRGLSLELRLLRGDGLKLIAFLADAGLPR